MVIFRPRRVSWMREAPNPYQVQMFTQDEAGNLTRALGIDSTLRELSKLYYRLNEQLHASPEERPTISTPEAAYPILRHFLSPLDHEELWTLCLDTRNRVISVNQIYKGSLNMSNVRVGELFKRPIIDNGASIIVSHNHPSGDPTPSPDDVAVTRAIVKGGKLLDIDVLDHIIVASGSVVEGSNGFVSLKERGLGFD